MKFFIVRHSLEKKNTFIIYPMYIRIRKKNFFALKKKNEV